MKIFSSLLTVTLLLAASLFAPSFSNDAFAQNPQYGISARILYGAQNVGTTNWVPVVSTLARSINGITILNSSTSVLQVGTAPAGATSNAEIQRMIVPASATGVVFYPLQVSAGYRVSIRAYTSTASAGEGQFNFFYN